MEPQTLIFLYRPQINRNSTFAVVGGGGGGGIGGGGGFGQQLKLPPAGRHGDGKSIESPCGVLDVGRISDIVKGSCFFLFFFKNSEEQKKWRKR